MQKQSKIVIEEPKNFRNEAKRKIPLLKKDDFGKFSQSKNGLYLQKSIHERKEKNRISKENSTNDQDLKYFECIICKKRFSKKTHLNHHVKIVHEGKKPYDCHLCNISLKTKQSLRNHITAFHEGKKLFECEMYNSHLM